MTEDEFIALAAVAGDAIDVAWDEKNQEWSAIVVFKNSRFATVTGKERGSVIKDLQEIWERKHDRG